MLVLSAVLGRSTTSISYIAGVLQVHLTNLQGKRLLLAFNDAGKAGVRTPLSLAVADSRVGSGEGSGEGSGGVMGLTWRRVAVVEDNAEGSFSYPTIQHLPRQVRWNSANPSTPVPQTLNFLLFSYPDIHIFLFSGRSVVPSPKI